MIAPRRAVNKVQRTPMATAAFVLAMALGSAVIWVLFATPAPPSDDVDANWWPGLHALPHR